MKMTVCNLEQKKLRNAISAMTQIMTIVEARFIFFFFIFVLILSTCICVPYAITRRLRSHINFNKVFVSVLSPLQINKTLKLKTFLVQKQFFFRHSTETLVKFSHILNFSFNTACYLSTQLRQSQRCPLPSPNYTTMASSC